MIVVLVHITHLSLSLGAETFKNDSRSGWVGGDHPGAHGGDIATRSQAGVNVNLVKKSLTGGIPGRVKSALNE
jgi:hypothetical protein